MQETIERTDKGTFLGWNRAIIINKICMQCNKKFQFIPHGLQALFTRKTCSELCRSKYLSVKTIKTQFKKTLDIPIKKDCKICKNAFYLNSNENLYYFIKRKTCSTQCQKTFRSLIAIERIKNHPNTNPVLIGTKTLFKKGQSSIWKGKKHSKLSKSRMSESHKYVIMPNRDTKPERMIQIWLTLNQIKFIKHKAIKFSNNRWVQVDIFIEPNIVIEVDGDYWHANPAKHKPDSIIAGGRYAKDIWAEDIQENHELNKLGYHIIRIWESEIKSGIDSATNPILNLLKSLNKEEVM